MNKNDKMIFSVTEAAKVFGISRNLAYGAVIRGEIPSIKIGRRILVPKIALDRMLNVGSPWVDIIDAKTSD